MQHWCWVVLLFSTLPLIAKDDELRGYVLDAAAFRNIQTYCIDTRYLPPLQERMIDRFVAHESHPKGLLAKLPWRRIPSCKDGAADARVRLEFPPVHSWGQVTRKDVNGVLLVFKKGAPSPIYETREVVVPGDENEYNPDAGVLFREQTALDSALRALVHDWWKFSTPEAPAAGLGFRRTGLAGLHLGAGRTFPGE